MSILIKNCRIISPQVSISCGAVLVEDGCIAGVFEDLSNLPNADDVVDAQGQLLVPGFIDIHTHGAGGFDVCDATLEAITQISKYKMEEGTTRYCPTTLTLSREQLQESMQAVASYMQDEQYAKVVGVHLEGPFVSQEAIGAQNPDFARLPDISEVEALNAIAPVAIITYAPELTDGLAFTQALSKLGIIPSAGHSAATCGCIRQAEKQGLKHLTHFCNQMTPLHHREIGMVGAGLMDDDLLIEVICDKVHVSEEMLQLIYKLKHPNKIAAITDSLSVTGLPDGEYNLGGLPIYLKGGVGRLSESDNLAGSTLRMNMALKNIHEVTGLPLESIVQTTGYNQAKSLGLDNVGKIKEGFVADLVLLDADFEVVQVFIAGQSKL